MRNARLSKIDVEGGEPEVIAGMTRFLELCRPDIEILIESRRIGGCRGRRRLRVLEPLFHAGFNAYEIDNNYWPWRYGCPGASAAAASSLEFGRSHRSSRPRLLAMDRESL